MRYASPCRELHFAGVRRATQNAPELFQTAIIVVSYAVKGFPCSLRNLAHRETVIESQFNNLSLLFIQVAKGFAHGARRFHRLKLSRLLPIALARNRGAVL